MSRSSEAWRWLNAVVGVGLPSQPSQASIEWSGVDQHGDVIANGTYLYRLRATPQRPGARRFEHIGKIVITR